MNDKIADTISNAQPAELKRLLLSSGAFVKGIRAA